MTLPINPIPDPGAASNMNRAFFILAFALCQLAAIAPAPLAPARTFTPEQAAKILDAYSSPFDIIAVLKAGITDEPVRKVILSWIDRKLPADAPTPGRMWYDYGQGMHLDFRNADGVGFPDSAYVDLSAALGANSGSGGWEIFQHLTESSYHFMANPVAFAEGLKPGSPAETQFLAYLPKAIDQFQAIGDYRENYGLVDKQTLAIRWFREQDPKKTPDSGNDPRPLWDSGIVVELYLYSKSEAVSALAEKLIFEEDLLSRQGNIFWYMIPSGGGSPAWALMSQRYAPRVVRLLHELLLDPLVTDKAALIVKLLAPPDRYRGASDSLSSANSEVFPAVLSFIADAEKMDLTPEAAQCLAFARQELHDWQASHPSAVASPPPVPTGTIPPTIAPAPASPVPSVTEARQIIATSDDLAQVFSALKVLAADPATRPEACAFVDQPLNQQKFALAWLKSTVGLSAAEIQQRGVGRLVENRYRDFVTGLEDDLSRFIAGNKDPGVFELYEHASRQNRYDAIQLSDRFFWALPPGSAMQLRFVNYLRDGILFLQRVEYENARGDRKFGGSRDTRTGTFTPALTPEEKAAFQPIAEHPSSLLGRDTFDELFTIASPAADKLLEEIASSPQIQNLRPTGPTNRSFTANLAPPDRRRYDPRVVDFMHRLLLNPAFPEKEQLIEHEFGPRDAGGSDVSNGPVGEQLRDATYAVYPALRAFIADANKQILPLGMYKWLAEYSAALDYFDSQRQVPLAIDNMPFQDSQTQPPPPAITSLDSPSAISTFKTSRDWTALTAALLTAAADPAARAAAIDFLDHPPPDREFFAPYFNAHQKQAANRASTMVQGTTLPGPGPALAPLLAAWAKQGDLVALDLFQHLVQSRLATEMYTPDSCFELFAKNLLPDSTIEAPFEDFFADAVTHWRLVYSLPEKWNYDRPRYSGISSGFVSVQGLVNSATHDFRAFVPGWQPGVGTLTSDNSLALYREFWLKALVSIGTDRAYAAISRIFSSPDYWQYVSDNDLRSGLALDDGRGGQIAFDESRLRAVFRRLAVQPLADGRAASIAMEHLFDPKIRDISMDWAQVTDEQLTIFLQNADAALKTHPNDSANSVYGLARKSALAEQTRRAAISPAPAN